MKTWLRNSLAVWAGPDCDGTNGIVVDGARIAKLVAAGNEALCDVDQTFDASNLVVIPGLINCHHHFYQTLTRAYPTALARQHGVPLQTHLGETDDENEFCIDRFGKRSLDHLAELGWLADDVWFAHGVRFSDDEISRLGEAGAGISHCPSSNMLLGSGICRVNELGMLEPGQIADIALFDLEALRFSGCGNPVAALAMCGALSR